VLARVGEELAREARVALLDAGVRRAELTREGAALERRRRGVAARRALARLLSALLDVAGSRDEEAVLTAGAADAGTALGHPPVRQMEAGRTARTLDDHGTGSAGACMDPLRFVGESPVVLERHT
jgi:hypothetical protein